MSRDMKGMERKELGYERGEKKGIEKWKGIGMQRKGRGRKKEK